MQKKEIQQKPNVISGWQRKVTVMARVKTDGIWRRFPALYGRRGAVRPGWVVIAGVETEFSDCSYELRYYEGGKKRYIAVGKNAREAETQRIRRCNQTFARNAAEDSGLKVAPEEVRLTLAKSAADYIEDCELRNIMDTASDARLVTGEFIAISGLTFVDEVSRKNILKFQKTLRDKGLSDRTLANKHHRLSMWLCSFSKFNKAIFPPTPKYEKKLPTVYNMAQINALFAGATPYERVVIWMAFRLGLRYQELIHSEFSDIDFMSKVYRVRSKPQYGFKIKDAEERDIPIPDDLLEILKRWQELHPGQVLIIPSKRGKPNKSLLRGFQSVAFRTGLACGICDGCKRNHRCTECTLHKFRRTYITGLLQGGIDLRTVQQYAGHSSLKSTMRYLRPASAPASQAAVSAIDWDSLPLGL